MRVKLPSDIHELFMTFGLRTEGDFVILNVPEAKKWIKYLEGPGRFHEGNYREGGNEAITAMVWALNEDHKRTTQEQE
jgi:hypothetical protein